MFRINDPAKRILPLVVSLVLMLGVVYSATVNAFAAGTKIAPDNVNLRYMGHWKVSSSQAAGYFQSGLEIRFTGTSLSLDLSSGKLAASVDGSAWRTYSAGNISVASGLSNGEHKVKIISDFQGNCPKISAFYIDSGAKILPHDDNKSIMFIGDSITLGQCDGKNGEVSSTSHAFPATVAQKLGMAFSVTAFGGICINGPSGANDTLGMADRYFRLGENGSDAQNVKFDTKSTEAPDYCVIALGTNGTGSSYDEKDTYKKFLVNLRSAYPKAKLICVTPFGINKNVDTVAEGVAYMKESKGDGNVYYINASGWSYEKCSDGVHPTYNGQQMLAGSLYTHIYNYIILGKVDSEGNWKKNISKDYSTSSASKSKTETKNGGDGTAADESDKKSPQKTKSKSKSEKSVLADSGDGDTQTDYIDETTEQENKTGNKTVMIIVWVLAALAVAVIAVLLTVIFVVKKKPTDSK